MSTPAVEAKRLSYANLFPQLCEIEQICVVAEDLHPIDKDGKPSIPQNSEHPVIANQDIASDELGEVVVLSVHSKFNKDYLCATEQQYRVEASTKKPSPAWTISDYAYYIRAAPKIGGVAPPDCKNPAHNKPKSKPAENTNAENLAKAACNLDNDGLYALSYLSSNPVTFGDGSESRPLVDSFCDRVATKIDWEKVAERRTKKDPAPNELHDAIVAEKKEQRAYLQKQLQAFLQRAPRSFEHVEILPDLDKEPVGGLDSSDTVQVAAVHRFTIIKEMGFEFDVVEHSGTED